MRLTTSLKNGSYRSSVLGMWAVVGGGTTMKIHSSFNVSALTDNGTGDFTLAMVVPFASASEYVCLSSQACGNFAASHIDDTNPPTASTVRIVTVSDGVGAFVDRDPVTVVALGRR